MFWWLHSSNSPSQREVVEMRQYIKTEDVKLAADIASWTTELERIRSAFEKDHEFPAAMLKDQYCEQEAKETLQRGCYLLEHEKILTNNITRAIQRRVNLERWLAASIQIQMHQQAEEQDERFIRHLAKYKNPDGTVMQYISPSLVNEQTVEEMMASHMENPKIASGAPKIVQEQHSSSSAAVDLTPLRGTISVDDRVAAVSARACAQTIARRPTKQVPTIIESPAVARAPAVPMSEAPDDLAEEETTHRQHHQELGTVHISTHAPAPSQEDLECRSRDISLGPVVFVLNTTAAAVDATLEMGIYAASSISSLANKRSQVTERDSFACVDRNYQRLYRQGRLSPEEIMDWCEMREDYTDREMKRWRQEQNA
ncbi:hypothetical protein OPT61_g3291 [Boeremia exigua]|uniref:Uncharacterized protein n=1 Tax=Boeremia exigua TaxID=749465 RepID=A0ACC2IIG1_9PLEO|nr:hypothetical protein OPT61_g3291 [Boeremia exigua]